MQFLSITSTLAMKMLLSLVLGLFCAVDAEELSGKCKRTYCSQRNNPEYIDKGCCTLKSASDCGCCLDSNDYYCSKCSPTLHPTWADCVNDWSNCCVIHWHNSYGHFRPFYIGVDWQYGANCCAVCNGGSWMKHNFPKYTMAFCDPESPPQMLCSSEQENEVTMLRHEAAAEE
uniref:Uncharacterized protein n=1 Tax=Ditylum brightwellii TaxID=49249 RepID=A0A6V2MBC9_9STRA